MVLPADHAKWVIGICSERWLAAQSVTSRGISSGASEAQAGDIASGNATLVDHSEICFRNSEAFSTEEPPDSYNDRE
jgi:hypothetical protein